MLYLNDRVYIPSASSMVKEKERQKKPVVNSKNKFVMLTKFASQLPVTFCSLSLIFILTEIIRSKK